VEALKKRVEVLEGGPVPPAPAAPSAAPAAPPPEDCPGASQLKMSMTQADVRRILGEPSKIDATPLQTRWRYACGIAYFDSDTRLFVGFERAR